MVMQMPSWGWSSVAPTPQLGIASARTEGGLIVTSRRSDPYWAGRMTTGKLQPAEHAEFRAFLSKACDTNSLVDFIHPRHRVPRAYTADTWPMAGDAVVEDLRGLRHIAASGLPLGLVLQPGDRVSLVQNGLISHRWIAEPVTVTSTTAELIEVTPRLPLGVFMPGARLVLRDPVMRLKIDAGSWDDAEAYQPVAISFDVVEALSAGGHELAAGDLTYALDFIAGSGWRSGLVAEIGDITTFTRAVQASWTGPGPGFRWADPDELRIDYAIDGSKRGALLEGTSQLLALRSEALDNASWTKSGTTVSPDAATAPDGTVTADTIVASASTALHEISQSGFSFEAGDMVSIDMMVEPAPLTRLVLAFESDAGASQAAMGFVLEGDGATMPVGLAPPLDQWCERYEAGRYRIGMTFLATAAASAVQRPWWAGDGAAALIVWGVSVQKGKRQSSVVTAGAPVTRPADQLVLQLPAGTHDVTVTFDDSSTQAFPAVGGNFALPSAAFTRPHVRFVRAVLAE